MRYLSEQQSCLKAFGAKSLAATALKSAAVCALMVVLSACGGGSDSGGGSTDSTGNGNGNGGAPAEGGAPSANHPASGFYERATSVRVTGGGADYSIRLRVVIDPGGGVAVFENNALRAQARIVGNQFTATARGVNEALFGLSCTGNRSYTGSVAGTNARVKGSLRGEFTCDANRRIVLNSAFDLPRIGDHQ